MFSITFQTGLHIMYCAIYFTECILRNIFKCWLLFHLYKYLKLLLIIALYDIYLINWWILRLFPIFHYSNQCSLGQPWWYRVTHLWDYFLWEIPRSKLAVTKAAGNLNYDAYKNWLFMSFAHFSLFLLICKILLYVTDILLGWVPQK